ncbi:MAG: hypothetical protein M1814_002912 [Vezdaea aestivalis]|nr:MAG: hypothetical protein M1814_002912 [Vezdaea aestivalis]
MLSSSAVAFLFPYSHFLLLVIVSIGLVIDILIEGGRHDVLLFGKPPSDTGKVPGNTATSLCAGSHQDIFAIESIWVSPWPARAGQRHTVEIKGYFREDVNDKARLLVSADYGHNQTSALAESYNFCSLGTFLGEDDQSRCPPTKGRTVIHYEPYIPWFAESETFRSQIKAQTDDKRRIFCMDATVDLIGNG